MQQFNFFAPQAAQLARPSQGIGDPISRGAVAGANAIAAGFSDAAEAIGSALEKKAARERMSGALQSYSDAVGDESKFMPHESRMGSFDDTMSSLIQGAASQGWTHPNDVKAFVANRLQQMNPALSDATAGQMAHNALAPQTFYYATEEHAGEIRRLEAEAIANGATQADIQLINNRYGQGKASSFQDLTKQLKVEAAQQFGMQEFFSTLQGAGAQQAGSFAALSSPQGREATAISQQDQANQVGASERARADANFSALLSPQGREAAAVTQQDRAAQVGASERARADANFSSLLSPQGREAAAVTREDRAAQVGANARAGAEAAVDIYMSPEQVAYRRLQFEESSKQRLQEFHQQRAEQSKIQEGAREATSRAADLITGSTASLPLATSRNDAREQFQRGDVLRDRLAGTPEMSQLEAIMSQDPSSRSLERAPVLLENRRTAIAEQLRKEFPKLTDQEVVQAIDAAAAQTETFGSLAEFRNFKKERIQQELDIIEETAMRRSLQVSRGNEFGGAANLSDVESQLNAATGTVGSLLRISDEEFKSAVKQFNIDQRKANQPQLPASTADMQRLLLRPGITDAGELGLDPVNAGQGGPAFDSFVDYLLGNPRYREQLESVAGNVLNAGLGVDLSPNEQGEIFKGLRQQAVLRGIQGGGPGAGGTQDGNSDTGAAKETGSFGDTNTTKETGSFGDTDILNQ